VALGGGCALRGRRLARSSLIGHPGEAERPTSAFINESRASGAAARAIAAH
jgi:hypothetical protein